jgi:hypothetical protein
MRKLFWLILAVLFFAAIAPNARADSSTPTFTTDGCFGVCVAATGTDVVFPSPAMMDMTFDGISELVQVPAGVGPGNTIYWVAILAPGTIDFDLFKNPPVSCIGVFLPIIAASCGTVSFSAKLAAAPEPGVITLMALGIGLFIVTRKRLGTGLRQGA